MIVSAEFKILFTLALGLFGGLFMSRIVKPLGLPAVTGYLLAGIVLGPSCLGSLGVTGLFVSAESMESMATIVQQVALGFIAFAIGTEFKLSSLRKTGKQATVIGIFQAVFAMIVVDAALIGLHFALGEEVLPLSVCITLGAIATATAPAATLMVVKQYKAKGPLTSLLLPIVALDDAVGLICFAASIGVAQALEAGGSISMISVVVNPVLEIVLSLALGSLVGVIFSFVENLFKSNSKRLCISITFVLLTIALSMLHYEFDNGLKIGFSSLLVCMMLGTLFCNICDSAEELMEKTDKWTMPIFVLFFVISGAELDFSAFTSLIVVLIGVVYIITRALGKYFGARFSAQAMKCSPSTVKYLGVTLLPQAGVAIGMSILAVNLLGAETGSMVRNIVLFAVMIYELVGPMATKIALKRAGDITPKPVEHKKMTVAEVFADDADDDE
ncbi:MAG: cation:proton antiporter [Clostridia bacterium]|nr:cation:proton antiporter [Clostridia bacterium]